MSSLVQNAIPFTFRYLDFSGGEPKEREEKRHFYFTMGSVKRMYEVAEVDEDEMEEAIEKGELDQGDPLPRADDEEESMGAEELQKNFDVGIKMMWAGLLAEAEARGEVLTVEHVGHMVGAGDELEDAMTAAAKALNKFLSGLSDEQQSDLAGDLQEAGKPQSQTA